MIRPILALLLSGLALTPPAVSGAEIQTLRLGEARLIAKGGRAPLFSPDGKRLLFARDPNAGWFDEWWLSGADGSGARLIFRSAKNPAWSPDGRRIAFNRSTGKVVIFDLDKNREFELFDNEGSRDINGPWWTADGKNLVFRDAMMADDEKNIPYLLDLNDLSAREIRTERRISEGWPGDVDSPPLFTPSNATGLTVHCTAEDGPFSQRVAYSDGSLPPIGDPHGGAFAGFWAIAEDGRLAVRLHPEECLGASIQSGRAAFSNRVGVRVASLTARKEPWNSRFSLGFGTAQGAEVGQHLVVYAKRVNPLNDQIVGFQEDAVKGAIEIIQVRENQSLGELVEWTGKPLRSDDVAAGEFQRVGNVFSQGGRVPARWAVMGAPLSTAALAGWDSEVQGAEMGKIKELVNDLLSHIAGDPGYYSLVTESILSAYPKECASDSRLLALLKIRLALVSILINNTTTETKHGRILQGRSASRAATLLKALSSLSREELRGDDITTLHGSVLIDELLAYHAKIVRTPGWAAKLKEIRLLGQLRNGAVFHERGFPRPDNKCYLNNGDYDASIEAWLYSFWARRHKEGTMDATVRALRRLKDVLHPA